MKFNISSLYILACLPAAAALTIAERAQTARSRLSEALSSPSGKLTLSPEILIPEPNDPTAILLLSTDIKTMSENIRVEAKANAAWISGSVTSLKTFCTEQEMSRGNFPGPVPVIYCDVAEDLASIVDAGAEGILISICGGEAISTLEDLAGDTEWVEKFQAALESGLQPIPEVTISDAAAESWKEAEMEALVSKLTDLSGEEPVSIVVTVNPDDDDDDDDDDATKEEKPVSLPTIAKTLSKKIPILGSVRVIAGQNRMGSETARFKEAGFTGALLRSDCLPGFRMNMNLEFVGNFWSACISDLKSLKSKNFNFQSRNWMDKSASIEWAKYQSDVIDSGALGDPNDAPMMGSMNPEAGDYVGF